MDQILATVQFFAFNYAPKGWAWCNGQILSIAQNNALFALLGTTYGGNGQTTFALPDLRGRSIVHPGQGPGLSHNVVWGEIAGTESVTLITNNMPAHVHNLIPGTAAGQVNLTLTANATPNGTITNETDNGNNTFASEGSAPSVYSEPTANTAKIGGITATISGTTSIAGSNIPFSIRNPYLGIYASIALEGIFPSRN